MEQFKPKKVCSRLIEFDVDANDKITYLKFTGGCPGNVQAIEKLCVGRTVSDVQAMLVGIKCRNNTSCPDQLSIALSNYMLNKSL